MRLPSDDPDGFRRSWTVVEALRLDDSLCGAPGHSAPATPLPHDRGTGAHRHGRTPGGMCVICERTRPEHVDHDHVTGRVRGILCFNCDGGPGQCGDNVEYLCQAVTYLKGTTPWVEISPGSYRLSSPTPAARHSPTF
ncbi:MAG: endonuclease domain-containing protein [Actinocatenispora sp.]